MRKLLGFVFLPWSLQKKKKNKNKKLIVNVG